ncbi:response regulator [Salidesulfovibrio brasiliensis]|uniref:response regulator n=1 Tax=Salidesulfovibrio brasiliensis TaxID=221711 RepID=UPI0006D12466|nr:response regulator [Salidesulfovibrio brasiliensis]
MNGETVKILLVDDEAGFTDVLTKRMSKRGFEVVSADSGTEAIRILRKEDFDVVVLDLKMEDMDGIEVLQVIRKMVPELPVIMLTGHGSETAAKDGLRYGAYDYLLKPCDLDELMAKIREAAKKA